MSIVSYPFITGIHNYNIRITCLCFVYVQIPHFYIVKLGYSGVYLFFSFLLQNIDCGYSEAVLTCTHNQCFKQKYEKYPNISIENLLHGPVFVMRRSASIDPKDSIIINEVDLYILLGIPPT